MNFSFRRLLPEKFRGFIFLISIWLFTGFALGVLILLWPLRLWVNYVRNNSYSATVENVGVLVLIGILLIISFRVSLALFHWHTSCKKIVITIFAIAIPLTSSSYALYLLMNPDIVNTDTKNAEVTQKITIGPYPTEKKIKELKKEGFTTVISLLHPAVVPFEPELLNKEEALLKKYNLQLIKAPMLPWVSDNSASLKLIEDVVKNGKGKYYIHCYLGKDRVNVVKNLILRLSGTVNTASVKSSRTFEAQGSFERGNIYKIDTSTYVPPFPTDEEFFAFFLAGDVKTVVNIMDSTIEDNDSWIRKERAVLESSKIIFKNIAVRETTDVKDVENVIDTILSSPKPLVVHHWNTNCPESKLLRKIYYEKTHYPQQNLANHNTEAF